MPIVAISVGVSISLIVLLSLGLILWDRQRQRLHLERLKILETGEVEKLLLWLENRQFMARIASTAISIGTATPVISFLAAGWISRGSEANMAISLAAWICACTASITSLICATVLMSRLDRSPKSN